MGIESLASSALMESVAAKSGADIGTQLAEKIGSVEQPRLQELSVKNAESVGVKATGISSEQLERPCQENVGEAKDGQAARELEAKTSAGIETGNDVQAETESESKSSDVEVSESDMVETNETDEVRQDKEAYLDDLKSRSSCPETIDDGVVTDNEFKRITPEENAGKREEFDEKKNDLIREWEAKNGREWPRYEQDVYSESGRLIRKAGARYDAHHIQPLCMGGENVVENITPLHAQEHYDHQGVHAAESPYSKLMKEV